ncbi:cobalt transport protein-domain-containing protein [Dunaliella salina]|uniref:Cobalt transport protein-domain-containing protein n=1 Tax=Dunaliella salina TaxID=3046 RepID=A0ABQ7GA19_DUNSA|nr:cobalt transport protein-domain-containing protein [Dunaliella salina]|eukprot:KAF5831445.1 cobalt transport protein-domain-containing protein [Dunaliella salina]
MQGIRVAHGHQLLPSASPKPCFKKGLRTSLGPTLPLRQTVLPPPPPLHALQGTGGQQQPAGSLGSPATTPKEEKPPIQQRVLNGILGISNVPYSSYVPAPATFLHRVDARIKQLWLVALYFMIARATPALRIGIAMTIALITILVYPPRLWQSQLRRLGLLCGAIFLLTALGADGVPPVLQPRAPPPSFEGLDPVPATGYRYVLLHVFFITVTHRSVNMAITAAALTLTSLQAASLCLVTTPGEEMALALRWWLTPLRILKVPVQEIALTLLLSLRFMSLVFEEVRNLCLGLAARGVNWKAQGGRGSLLMAGRLCVRLFANLFHRSENIAQAMAVRGFQGPQKHRLHMMSVNTTSVTANCIAMILLGAFYALIFVYM